VDMGTLEADTVSKIVLHQDINVASIHLDQHSDPHKIVPLHRQIIR
jgi:hypothetical protein